MDLTDLLKRSFAILMLALAPLGAAWAIEAQSVDAQTGTTIEVNGINALSLDSRSAWHLADLKPGVYQLSPPATNPSPPPEDTADGVTVWSERCPGDHILEFKVTTGNLIPTDKCSPIDLRVRWTPRGPQTLRLDGLTGAATLSDRSTNPPTITLRVPGSSQLRTTIPAGSGTTAASGPPAVVASNPSRRSLDELKTNYTNALQNAIDKSHALAQAIKNGEHASDDHPTKAQTEFDTATAAAYAAWRDLVDADPSLAAAAAAFNTSVIDPKVDMPVPIVPGSSALALILARRPSRPLIFWNPNLILGTTGSAAPQPGWSFNWTPATDGGQATPTWDSQWNGFDEYERRTSWSRYVAYSDLHAGPGPNSPAAPDIRPFTFTNLWIIDTPFGPYDTRNSFGGWVNADGSSRLVLPDGRMVGFPNSSAAQITQVPTYHWNNGQGVDLRAGYNFRSLLSPGCGSGASGSCSTSSGRSSGNFGFGLQPFGSTPWSPLRIGFNYDTGSSFRATLTPPAGGSLLTPTVGELNISHRYDLTLGYEYPFGKHFAFQPYIGMSNLSGNLLSPVRGPASVTCTGTGSEMSCFTTPGPFRAYQFNTTRGLYGLALLYALATHWFGYVSVDWSDVEDFELPNSGALSGSVGFGYRFNYEGD